MLKTSSDNQNTVWNETSLLELGWFTVERIESYAAKADGVTYEAYMAYIYSEEFPKILWQVKLRSRTCETIRVKQRMAGKQQLSFKAIEHQQSSTGRTYISLESRNSMQTRVENIGA